MSVSLGKKQGAQRGETNVDPETQARMKQMWDAAQAAGQSGPSPLVTGASDFYGGLMKGGNLGMGALSGDPSSIASLMNPYTSNVIGNLRTQADVTNQQGINAVNDRATQAGAFGGSRQGVATGTMLAQNSRDLNSQIGNLYNTQYGDAMSRAMQMAGMGFAGAGQQANLGMGGVGSPQQWMLNMLNQGYKGPQGSSTTGHQTDVSSGMQFDPFKMFMGGMGGAKG